MEKTKPLRANAVKDFETQSIKGMRISTHSMRWEGEAEVTKM